MICVTAFVAATAVLSVPTWINNHHQRGRQQTRAHAPEHWSIVVVDIANFGRWTNQNQLRARAVLNKTVRAAFHEAGIGWSRLVVEDRGDGMIVLIPADVSKVNLLDPVIPSLATAIRRHNNVISTADRIRLRVSVHAGEIHRDRCGWAGADLNLPCRLVNAEPVYQQLRDSPEADLILVVSDLILHSVVRHGYRRIDPASYTPTQVITKEVNTRAWLHVPRPDDYGSA